MMEDPHLTYCALLMIIKCIIRKAQQDTEGAKKGAMYHVCIGYLHEQSPPFCIQCCPGKERDDDLP